jgi:hypothetical protein
MTKKSDPYSIKALTKLARSPAIKGLAKLVQTPAMRQTLKAVKVALPVVKIASPLMEDIARAQRLSELVRSVVEKNIPKSEFVNGVQGDVFKELQEEIDTGAPLTGRQILFLTMEVRGGDSLEELKELAAKGEIFTHGGRRKGATSKPLQYIIELAKNNRTLSAKKLFAIADKSIIKLMEFDAFRSHVTKARKKYPKEKSSK